MTPLTLPEWKTQGGPTAEQRRFKNTEIIRELSTPGDQESKSALNRQYSDSFTAICFRSLAQARRPAQLCIFQFLAFPAILAVSCGLLPALSANHPPPPGIPRHSTPLTPHVTPLSPRLDRFFTPPFSAIIPALRHFRLRASSEGHNPKSTKRNGIPVALTKLVWHSRPRLCSLTKKYFTTTYP